VIRERLEHAADESGFTLIELLVAATILVVGVFGLVTSVETSHKLSDVSERETAASQVADRELDLALTIPYTSVALTSLPATAGPTADGTQWNNWLPGAVPHPSPAFTCSSASSTNNNPTDPNDERSTSCIAACPTVSSGTGCPAVGRLAAVSTVSAPTATGTVRKLKVYRYVTWVNDLACGASCPNPPANGYKGDYKRVTIAVLPVLSSVTDTTGASSNLNIDGPKKPVVVSAIRNDPAFTGGGQPGSPSPCGIGGVQC
jgi:prepilin-type N-terminal cleavage/methylation domain-containing protein